MPEPPKYVIYVKSETRWYPMYYFKTDSRFITRMLRIATYSPNLKVIVRITDALDGSFSWHVAYFNWNGHQWALKDADQSYIEREGLNGA